MGSFFNFKNFEEFQLGGSGGKMTTPGNAPLARQSSVYSLTFDELQDTFGGDNKDFGSMNMEELLKNIWTVEENQASASSAGVGNGVAPSGSIQRQGSLALPRTLSQKTVDEVWRDMYKESTISANGGDSVGLSSLVARQNTLGEMTLEEFLMRAGVAREDPQPAVNPTVGGFYGALAQPCSNTSGLNIEFQPVLNQNVLGNQYLESSNQVPNSSNVILNLGGTEISRQEQQKKVQAQHQPLFSNESSVTFSSGVPLGNTNFQITSLQPTGPVVSMSNSSSTLVQDGAAGLGGFMNLPSSGVTISPGNHMSSTVTTKRKSDIPPVAPLYTVGEGGRGRKSSGSLEKVVERRRKRMIKNRESAARSRARKQAYTLELEAEVATLKEINQELQKKQEELMEMQKTKILDMVKIPPRGGKRRCLERTMTGPW